uniref:Uncharacterized protein n=1 Tax=Lepeophtheirus salmonis TaxID=72036 RepID=A0A0K2UL09_LEPSM
MDFTTASSSSSPSFNSRRDSASSSTISIIRITYCPRLEASTRIGEIPGILTDFLLNVNSSQHKLQLKTQKKKERCLKSHSF